MMVMPPNLSYLRLVTRLRGSVLVRIWPRLLVTFAWAGLITWLAEQKHLDATLTELPFTLIGLALSIFLGFRNNTSYERFWEGRKLWGALVNTSRNLTRQVLTLVGPQQAGSPEDPEVRRFQRECVHRLAAYVHALRLHLRDAKDWRELGRLIPEDDLARLAISSNAPMRLAQDLGERLAAAYQRGWIHAQHLPVLEHSLSQLLDIQGGCERIKSTPIPFSYTLLIHRIVAIYCLALPLGIVTKVHGYTPLVALLVAYAFFGLDAIGDEIEEPFGTHTHDLPLSALSTMIEINVREALGETDLPRPLSPRGEVLQ